MIAHRKLKGQLTTKHIQYLTMASTFCFVIIRFNIPILGETTGHTVGAAIIAFLLEPQTAVLIVPVILIIQTIL
ncbi:MAG: energy-coupling factor ABC transporter permease [Thermodesulfobacteriota bacterium]